MTYLGFLLCFIGVPLALLAALTAHDGHRGGRSGVGLNDWPGWLVLLLHVLAAVVWTTPWDNYLVATGVWYYNPRLVTGITLGWVPIEEYTFFVVQTLLTGLWLLWLARRLGVAARLSSPRPRLRAVAATSASALWLAAIGVLLSGWRPGTYLALELGWLLPPIILQLAVGADVLWHQRRWVALALGAPWLYLSAADLLAIGSGTWTIAPGQSTGLMVADVLPIEEVVFFLLTNMLIVFGMTLFLTSDMRAVRRQFSLCAGKLSCGRKTDPEV